MAPTRATKSGFDPYPTIDDRLAVDAHVESDSGASGGSDSSSLRRRRRRRRRRRSARHAPDRPATMMDSTPWQRVTRLAMLTCTLLVSLAATGTVVLGSTLDRSLTWGTYRPQVYFGIRAAEPNSLLSGLVWFSPRSADSFLKARHECDEGDKINGYGYTYHDGRSLAIQEIRDEENNYVIETTWLKTGISTPDAAGSWAVRIAGRVIDETKPASLSPIYYFSLESPAHMASFEPNFEPSDFIDGLPSEDEDGPEDGRFFRAGRASQSLPGFSLRFSDTPTAANKPARASFIEGGAAESEFTHARSKWHYLASRVNPEISWRGKELVQSDIGASVKKAFSSYDDNELPNPPDLLTLKDAVEPSSNFVALQRTFTGNFSIDIFYDSDDTPNSTLLTSDSFSVALKASKDAYDEKFDQTFPLPQESADRKAFARALTSQIVGSVGYYYGQSIVDRSFRHDYDEIGAPGEKPTADPQLTAPSELLTATPSRTKFPRGFYWDEGFHLAHISVWDPSLSLEIFQSWMRLVDEDGWVAREQILGDEARSRVPPEFQVQNPTYGNPPTLAMTMIDYIDRLQKRHPDIFSHNSFSQVELAAPTEPGSLSSSYIDDPDVAREFLSGVYPKLRSHYLWFRSTQRGQIKEWGREARARREAFRWRGRTKDHVLTSGLDDYPRAPVPHVGELHLDLHCWMGSFAEAMTKVAVALGEEDDLEEYEEHYKGIVANVDDLHWSEAEQMYCDASVNEDEESIHVCHRGYLSLFPLLTQLLPVDNVRVKTILDLMQDPKHLWSSYGLRSLSKQDPLYGKGEDYWRGPIWLPMNYLALRALKKKYAAEPGPYQVQAGQLYERLRANLVDNVQREYRRTGFTWEQYHPESGRGQRASPFTGWTSMAAMILAEEY